MSKATEYQQALRLVQGENIDRKELGDTRLIEMHLQSFKNNCNIVLRQFKRDRGAGHDQSQ